MFVLLVFFFLTMTINSKFQRKIFKGIWGTAVDFITVSSCFGCPDSTWTMSVSVLDVPGRGGGNRTWMTITPWLLLEYRRHKLWDCCEADPTLTWSEESQSLGPCGSMCGFKKETERAATLDLSGFLTLGSGPSFLLSFQFRILASQEV